MVRGEELFPHDEFAPFIGDVIHNLRDALDLAIAVIMRNAGESDKNVYFPNADTLEAFEKSIAKEPRKPRFPDNLINVLRSEIEPYKGGSGYHLRILHKLAITDKHRMIVPTVFGTTGIAINTEGMNLPFYIGATPLRIRTGVAFTRILASEFPHIEIGQEADLTLTIAFDNIAGTLSYLPIEDALRRLHRATDEAVNAMRVCL